MRTRKIQVASCMLVVLLSLAMFIGGCKTVKKTLHTEKRTEVVQSNDVVVASDSISRTETKSVLTDTSVIEDSLVVNEVTVFLSKPDSVGKQFPERVTYREMKKGSKTEKKVNLQKDSILTSESKHLLTDKSVTRSDTTEEMVEKSKVKKPPTKLMLLIFFIVAIFTFCYFIFKRFKPF